MRYKIILSLLIFFKSAIIVIGQANVYYNICNGCNNTVANDGINSIITYGDSIRYQPEQIVSDFGPRCRGGYDFHGGVDFSSQGGDDDRGDLILAIERGIVSDIAGESGYKYIIISNGTHRYGYGHIFNSRSVDDAGGYLKSGNMVLKALDNFPNIFAIIFLDTKIAISKKADEKVTWNGEIFTTKDTVSVGQAIAPIGDSADKGDLDAHIHIYAFPRVPVLSVYDDAFVDNALENLTYQPKGILTAMLLHGEDQVSGNYRALSPNDLKSSDFSKLRVRCQTSSNARGSNSSYFAFMDVDEVRLKIKQTNEKETAYKVLRGASFDSKIALGGRKDVGTPYPKHITDNNTGGAYTIASGTDNPANIKNGVIPWMYCDDYTIGKTRPYDDYVFADIATRLHKEDPKEQSLDKKTNTYAPQKLATWQKDALYTDGEYQLRAEVLRINNEVVTSAPLTFTIDNFKPYLEEVYVVLDGRPDTDPIYAAAWNFNASLNEGKGGLQNRVSRKNPSTETSYLSNRKLHIRAKYSEAMKVHNLLLRDKKGNTINPLQIETIRQGLYEYTFDYNDIDRILSEETNTYTIHASGTDYGGNRLLNLHKMTGYPNNMVIPYKKADNTWSATTIDAANDESFVFDLQGTCSGNGGILPEEVVVRSPQAGCKLVRFTYKIQSSGCNVTFVSNDTYDAGYWAFGDGGIFEPAPYNGTKATVKHSYTKPGTYKVRLWYGNNTKNFHEEDIVIAGCAEDNTAAREKNIECQVIGPTLAKAGEVVTLTGVITGFGPFYDSPWEYDPTKATPTSPNPKGDGAHDFTINPFLMEGDRVLIDLKAKNDYRATKTCTHEIVISGNPPKVKLLQYNTRYPKRPLLLAITQHVPSFSLVLYQFIITRNGTAPVVYDRNGVYEFVPDGDLIDGTYTAVVKATYDNVTATSNQVIFTIGTPPAPVPSAPDFEVLPAGNIEITMGDCTPLLQLKMNNLPPVQKVYDVTYENQNIGRAIVNERYDVFNTPDDNYCIRAKQLGSNGKVLDKGEVLVPYSIARRDGVVLNEKFCPSYEYVGCVDVVYEVCPKAHYNGKYVLNNMLTQYSRPAPTTNLCEPVIDNEGDFYGTIPLFPLVIKEPCKINVKYKEMVINDFAITAACQPSIAALVQYGAADFSKGIVPSGAPCSGTQAYKNYTWKAFDARNPTQELVGFLQNINSECVYIQTNHVYLQQFKQGDTVEFMCQVTITDWLDITKTYSKFVTMAVPLRIDIPTTLPMCVGIDKSFEKYEVAISGSNTINVSLSNSGEYVQIDNNGELHIQLPTDYTNGNINAVLSATDGNGCSISKSITVQPSELRITNLPTTQTGCAFTGMGSNTLGPVSVAGGTGKYTYAWSPQEGLEDVYSEKPRLSGAIPRTSTTYTLTVTDSYGCAVASNPVTVNWMNEFYGFQTGGDKTVCYGAPVTLGENQIEFAGYTTEWTSDNPNFTGSTSPALTIPAQLNKTAGTFTYRIRAVHTESGCYDYRDIKVKVLNDWLVKGYETAIKFTENGRVQLWSSTDNQIIPSTDTHYQSGATPPFIYTFSRMANVHTNDVNMLPTGGSFVPSPTAFLTMKVADANGCKREFKTTRGIVSAAVPTTTISMYLPDKIGGYAVCANTKTVFKVNLNLNYQNDSVALPPMMEADVTIHWKKRSGIGNLKVKEDKVLLYLLDNARGIYEGNYEYIFNYINQNSVQYTDYIEVLIVGDLNNSQELNTGNTFSARYEYEVTTPTDGIQTPKVYCGNRTAPNSAQAAAFTIGKKGSVCSYVIGAVETEILAAAQKGNITLYPGFETQMGCLFLAYIDPCIQSGSVALDAKLILQGPYNTSIGLMNDKLRELKLIPLTEPYTAIGHFSFVNGGGGETTTQAVFDVTGETAIVDWVFIELRDKNMPSTVLYTRAALLQRNGRVVDIDGISPVVFQNVPQNNYYVAIKHRNHLGVMTGTAQTFTNILDSGQ